MLRYILAATIVVSSLAAPLSSAHAATIPVRDDFSQLDRECRFYLNVNFTGYAFNVKGYSYGIAGISDDDQLALLSPWVDNKISSLVCASRCEATVWTKRDYKGRSAKFALKRSRLSTFNDKISSIKVKCY